MQRHYSGIFVWLNLALVLAILPVLFDSSQGLSYARKGSHREIQANTKQLSDNQMKASDGKVGKSISVDAEESPEEYVDAYRARYLASFAAAAERSGDDMPGKIIKLWYKVCSQSDPKLRTLVSKNVEGDQATLRYEGADGDDFCCFVLKRSGGHWMIEPKETNYPSDHSLDELTEKVTEEMQLAEALVVLALGLAALALVSSLVSWIWMVVEAFRKSPWWGLGVFLVPYACLPFVIMNWQQSKAPVFLFLFSTVASAACLGFICYLIMPLLAVLSEIYGVG